ncbi:MAG TPA: hypothetical protein VHR66_26055 [Gemmataceae bacterium]|jgi:hypothetical protein|nr:hypothetical protein [Gemmataceae bacterium]
MILDVSRIQLGKIPITDAPLDLGEMFREMLEVIRIKAKEKEVGLTVSVPPALPIAVLDKRYTRMAGRKLAQQCRKVHADGRVRRVHRRTPRRCSPMHGDGHWLRHSGKWSTEKSLANSIEPATSETRRTATALAYMWRREPWKRKVVVSGSRARKGRGRHFI